MPIVTISVSQQLAPIPPTLQRSGAIISVGATVLTPGTASYLTQLSDLTPLIKMPAAISSLTWTDEVVTADTASPHGLATGAMLYLTIAGASPAGYNGTYPCTVTGTSSFTYPLATNPGSETTPGTWQSGYATRLTAAATTWFAQGNRIGTYVLELGPNTTSSLHIGEIAALSAYLAVSPNVTYTDGAQGYYYCYLVPPQWDGIASFITLAGDYGNDNAMTYFFTTTTLSTYRSYVINGVPIKSVFLEAESPQMSAYPQNAITATTWTGGVVTATTTTAHGVSVGDWFQVEGYTPVSLNGWWQAQAGTTGSTLIWNLAGSGSVSAEGSLVANMATNAGIPATEFTTAASMYDVISNDPSSSNKVPPLAYTFQNGVTAWPTLGMSALLATLQAANVNYVGTGAEGGVSRPTLFNGTLQDGSDFLIWYSVDAAQIYSNINLSNTVINGSNNNVNPLYYNQQGINRLQDNEVDTMNSLVSWGLANGTVVTAQLAAADLVNALNAGTYAGQILVNAEPFLAYLAENPDDYAAEVYNGLSVQYIASRGFRNIQLNLLVTDFLTQ